MMLKCGNHLKLGWDSMRRDSPEERGGGEFYKTLLFSPVHRLSLQDLDALFACTRQCFCARGQYPRPEIQKLRHKKESNQQ